MNYHYYLLSSLLPFLLSVSYLQCMDKKEACINDLFKMTSKNGESAREEHYPTLTTENIANLEQGRLNYSLPVAGNTQLSGTSEILQNTQNPIQNIITTLAALQTLTGATVTVTSAPTHMVPYIYRGFKAIGTCTFFQQTDDDHTPTAPVNDLAPDATNKVPTPSNNILVAPATPQVNNHNSIDLQIQDYIDELYLPFREDMERKKQQKIAAKTAQGLDASAYVTKADAKIADYTKKVAKILITKKHGNNLDFSVPPANHWLQLREKTLNKCYTMGNHQ